MVDADGVYRKVGPARVFTSEPAAIAAIKQGRIKAGDVLVVICRGPMGAGMEETYQLTSALKYLDYGKHVAVLTDARFSGVSTGACIGHISPEALAGGPIGKVLDGDLIEIIVDRNTAGRQRKSGHAGSGSSDTAAARRSRARSGVAGRHAAVGRVAGRQRRSLGRLRVRYRGDIAGYRGGKGGVSR